MGGSQVQLSKWGRCRPDIAAGASGGGGGWGGGGVVVAQDDVQE